MMPAPMSWSEAFLAMFAMPIVLVFVLIYYCCIPVYRGMQRQKQREEEQQDWENDPRWNRERFSFVPRRPKNFMQDKKYSRMAACSRTSSMRSDVHGNAEAVPPVTAVDGKPPPSKPPKYSELYETGSTSNGSNLGTPPRYTSKPSSSAEASQENVAIPPPPKPKIIKPKKNRKPVPPPPPPATQAAAAAAPASSTDAKPADSIV